MEIWLDTIDLEAIKDAAKVGLISGVTTNPSILSKSKDVKRTIDELLDLQPGPVAVQVTQTDPKKIVDEARSLSVISARILVKIPINKSGLIAINELREDKIPILGTAVLFPIQALMAANLGIASIAPYFSHMDNAVETMKVIQDMYVRYQFSTKILAASLKSLEQLLYCASLGISAVTIKADLYALLVAENPTVENFIQKFRSDWMSR